MKRNNLKNLFCLLLVVLGLYLLDDTRLSKVLWYQKVKEYIEKDINVFGLSKGLFGDKLFNFYQLDSPVFNEVVREEKYKDGYMVYLDDDRLYSTYVGTVLSISKNGDFYNVTIGKSEGVITIYNLVYLDLNVYDKVEVGTLIGWVNGSYYYEES